MISKFQVVGVVSIFVAGGVAATLAYKRVPPGPLQTPTAFAPQVVCDRRAAEATIHSGPDLADVDTTNGLTTWRIDPESWPPIMGNSQDFVRKVAAANACINTPLQHIVIRDPDGKFLGETGPAGTHVN